jgi:hypothetical protein
MAGLDADAAKRDANLLRKSANNSTGLQRPGF